MATTRFNSIGVWGPLDKFAKTDPSLNGAEYRIPVVASAAAQTTDLFIPAGAIICCYLDIKTPESTGTTPTIDVGFAGGSGSELLNGINVASAGVKSNFSSVVPINLLEEITYTLGSADFAEMEADLVIMAVLKGKDA